MKEADKGTPSRTTKYLARISTDCGNLSGDNSKDFESNKIVQKLRSDTDEISKNWKAVLKTHDGRLDPESESDSESDFGVQDIWDHFRMIVLQKEMELNDWKVSHSKIDCVNFFKC